MRKANGKNPIQDFPVSWFNFCIRKSSLYQYLIKNQEINFLIDSKGQIKQIISQQFIPVICKKEITLTHALLTFMTGEVARMLKRGMQII